VLVRIRRGWISGCWNVWMCCRDREENAGVDLEPWLGLSRFDRVVLRRDVLAVDWRSVFLCILDFG
jgi:hypothetical protein